MPTTGSPNRDGSERGADTPQSDGIHAGFHTKDASTVLNFSVSAAHAPPLAGLLPPVRCARACG